MTSKLLVTYMTLGFPDPPSFAAFIEGADQLGTDIFELGYPPSFAKYDGPTIRKSYASAKAIGADFPMLIKKAREITHKKIIVLSYLEGLQDHLDSFLETVASAGADGVLFPDLLVDFSETYSNYVKKVLNKGLAPVVFVSPFMPDRLIAEVSRISEPFLYLGVRPTTGIPTPVDVSVLVNRVRDLSANDIVVGFGLRNDHDVREAIIAGANGIAVGTAYVEAAEKQGVQAALKVVTRMRSILDEFERNLGEPTERKGPQHRRRCRCRTFPCQRGAFQRAGSSFARSTKGQRGGCR